MNFPLPKTPLLKFQQQTNSQRNLLSLLSLICLSLFLFRVSSQELQPKPEETENPKLTILTLNIAHGRKDGTHQALTPRKKIKKNLNKISKLLQNKKPSVVALQEADGPSLWSGRFNHVEYLAEKAVYPHFFRGEHVNGMKLSYGTAILSLLPLKDTASVTFDSSWPTPKKGFVISTILFPENTKNELDIVSVHLDFSRESVRKKQVKKMIVELSHRNRPLIIMGDFNCEWPMGKKENALKKLIKSLKLKSYQPVLTGQDTFPSTTKQKLLSKKRLDWILISKHFQFESYQTLPDVVSDHLAVLAEVSWRLNVKK